METIKSIVEKSTDKIAKASTKKECSDLWREFINNIGNHQTGIGEGGDILTTTDHTMRQAVSTARRHIKEKLSKKSKINSKRRLWLLGTVKDNGRVESHGIAVSDLEVVKRARKQSSEARKIATVAENIKKLKGIDRLIYDCKMMLNSNKWESVAVGLMLLTGRRSTEILQTGTLKRIKGNSELMEFMGQAKTNNKDLILKIPVLCPPSVIEKALKKLRRMVDFSGMDNEAFNAKTQKPLERKTTKTLKDYYGETATSHDLRKIYTAYCIKEVLPTGIIKSSQGTITLHRDFVKAILGHSKEKSGAHYQTWEVQ